jgi:hypothetical protein
MNKIKKFRKSKKTNNKRNHKRRRMTRKLRGGVIKPEWPLNTPQPLEVESKPPPLNDEAIYIPSRIEPSQEIQSLEDRINENPQRKELVTREDYDILRDNMDQVMDDLNQVMDDYDALHKETTKYETMVPLIFGADNRAIFINKNITAFILQNIPVPRIINGGPDYRSHIIDLYQLIKFKRLQKIDFSIIISFRILFPGVDENGMPNYLFETPGVSREDMFSKKRELYNFFKENFNSEIKYIYRSSARIDSPPIEYDLEGLEDILIRDDWLRE